VLWAPPLASFLVNLAAPNALAQVTLVGALIVGAQALHWRALGRYFRTRDLVGAAD